MQHNHSTTHTTTPSRGPLRRDDCALCNSAGGKIIWENTLLRVIDAADPQYPGLTRVIWQAHVREMTDLDPHARAEVMKAVWTVEKVLRQVLRPDKVNVASLGNMVAHVHWHVIPRFQDDAHFPDAIWAAKKREALARIPQALVDEYHQQLQAAMRDSMSGTITY